MCDFMLFNGSIGLGVRGLRGVLSDCEEEMIHTLPLPRLNEIINQYTLGKMELMNRYLEQPLIGYYEIIKYCQTYTEEYGGVEK